MFQTPFADRIRNEAGIATIAVGAISEADHVNSIIAAGRADLCAIARPHLANPAWTLHRGGARSATPRSTGRSSTARPSRSSSAISSASSRWRRRAAGSRRSSRPTARWESDTHEERSIARPLEDAQELGHEARAGSGDHAALRLWLRMLACTTQIEGEIRRRLRERFGISLARFDYLAQLYRYKDGMKMTRAVALPDGDRRQRHRPHRRPRG